MKAIFDVARAAKRELMATTALATFATLAMSPIISSTRAFAQTADQAGESQTLPLPPVNVNAGQGGNGAGDPTGTGAGESGGRFTGCNAVVTIAATKTETPILQTPLAIQVVPRETMDDQQAISVEDAITSNVSGVSAANFTLPYETFTIRGFSTGENVYINGLRQTNNLYGIETQNLQSIDVLKGPSAMLYGRVEAGGLVDLLLKRPLDTPYYSFQEQAGSFGTTRTTFDVTGPLTADKTWLYRVNGDFEHADSFVDFVESGNVFIAPTITYHPIEQFRMNVDVMYQHRTTVDDSVFPAIGDRPAPIPISRYLQQPSLTATTPARMDTRYIGYDWTYDLAPTWSLTNRFDYQNAGFTNSQTPVLGPPFGAGVNQTTGAMSVYPFYGNYSQQTIATNLDLKGKFDTGPLKHSLLLGLDYFNNDQPLFGLVLDEASVVKTNIYDPNYALFKVLPSTPNTYGINKESWEGAYVQDMISTQDDAWHLLLGGRYDWAMTGSSFCL